jgi:lysyl-tRNA synthetase class 2
MLDELIKERNRKLELYQKFSNPYPARVKRNLTIKEALAGFARFTSSKKNFFIVGRVRGLRDQGQIIFIDIEDETNRMQAVLSHNNTKNFDLIKKTLDIGDFLEVSGKFFKTKRGEKSLLAKTARIIAKSLRPLPQEWFGLKDIETRLRARYLDLILNPEAKELFRRKSIFWETVRHSLKKAGFLEVETPVLEPVPGGAEAEPFQTHHNALNEDFYLRISLELPLKKLLVGGYEKVFEIGRIFRNEGIDKEHLQDYTQMECYAAYWDYHDMMDFIEKIYKMVIKSTLGTLTSKVGGKNLNWGKRWPKLNYYEVFQRETGLDLKTADREDLAKKASALGVEFEKSAGRGRLIDLIFKKTARPKLWEPCFLIDPPVDIEPLAKRSEKDKDKVERFQIFAAGTELGKGFSELNDPIDQRKRFEEQMKLRAAGDKEAQRLDEDFLTALEYGMPPAAGFGMSERVFAVLMDKPVRECVFFPLMKKK